MFALNFSGVVKVFINPLIQKQENLIFSRESDPSVDGEYILPRYEKIAFLYQTIDSDFESNLFEGQAAIETQRMIGLLDGILISDYGLYVTKEFDEATDEERAELLKLYSEELKKLGLEINDEIESNEGLKKTYDAIKFMTSVATGETKLDMSDVKLNREQRRKLKKLGFKKGPNGEEL